MSSSNEEKVFKCPGCDEEFSMQDVIARNIHQHCDKCGQKIEVFSSPRPKSSGSKDGNKIEGVISS